MKILRTAIALALVMSWAGCSDGGGRTDAGPDADAADADDGGDPDPGDGQPDGDAVDGGDEPVELTVTAVLPSRGPVEGGTWANVIGSGFVHGIGESPFDVRDVTDVTFGDNAAIDIEIIRDDMISVRTPPGVAGPAQVTVENPNGRVSLPGAFDYFETVRVDSLDPTDFSSVGGTRLAVEGTGFTPDTDVLVGDRPAAGVVVESNTRLFAFAPPGEPGTADVQVINRNGNMLLFRAVTYHPVPRLWSLEPAAGPEAGGIPVTAAGQGFEQGMDFLFAGVPALEVSVADGSTLTASTPAGPAGPVDVTAQGVVDEHTLAGGFVYLPDPVGALDLAGVSPAAGPVQGGRTVLLAGEGFLGTVEEVLFGTEPATDVQVIDDRLLRATVPAGQVGPVGVEVRTGAELDRLDDAYRYFEPIEVDGIQPQEGPAEGGTAFSLTGRGFSAGTEVLFGGLPADSLQVVSATELAGTSPPGPVGHVDVIVRDRDSQVTLEEAFRYTAQLDLQRVDPDFGAQAGGTYVTVYGRAFASGMRIWFGRSEASLVQVLSSSMVTARAPRGDPGEVDVAVELGDERAELPAGFSYVDPTNDRGGASGGPISGSINVTCLDGTWINWGDPVFEATVVIDSPALTGLTDERGQVTFSGPSLVREVTLTAAKDDFQSITVANLNAANLTVYMYPYVQPPSDPIPIDPIYSTISGRVFGFKDIPGLPFGPTITYLARVIFTYPSIYYVPPYGPVPRGTDIPADGDAFNYTVRLGQYSLYAMYGAFDTQTEEFFPALLGVRRGIQVTSENPVEGQDVVLSTPLDRSVVVLLEDPPLGTAESPAEYRVCVSLDLGADGIIYLNQVKGTSSELVLTGLPRATGDSFLFVGLASLGSGYPYSFAFRRQAGDLADGVTMGPFLGFTELVDPPQEGELSGGRLAWSFQGSSPELTFLRIQTSELMPRILWQVIVPGEVTEVQLPEELLGVLPQGEPLMLLLYTANSPRFNFDRFNYGQLSSSRWTSYTVNYTTFTAP